MADSLTAKVKVVRAILEDFKKRLSTFSSIEKSLQDSVAFLTLQISDFEDDFKKAKSFHTEIIALGDEENEEFSSYINQKVFEAIQNIYFKHSTTLHEYLRIVSKSDHNSTFIDASPSSTHHIQSNSIHQNQLFAPDIRFFDGLVPEFDGNYGKWPEFMDSYLCNIHENEALSDGTKVKILNRLLKGDALKVVKREFGILKTSEYAAIWEKLVDRYNHKTTIVYAYFKELCFQPHAEKENSESLKLIYDTTYDTVSSLRRLGFKVDGWGDLLLFLIYSKLPLKTKEIWNERFVKPDSLPKFSKFLEFLENRFRTLEGLEACKKNDSILKPAPRKVSTLQTTTVTTKNSQPSSASKFLCKLCNKGSHALRKCFAFKSSKLVSVSEKLILLNTAQIVLVSRIKFQIVLAKEGVTNARRSIIHCYALRPLKIGTHQLNISLKKDLVRRILVLHRKILVHTQSHHQYPNYTSVRV